MIGRLVNVDGKFILSDQSEAGLISVICDLRNDESIRDDAAMDLEAHGSELTISTLVYVARFDPSVNVRESALESLGGIFERETDVDAKDYIESMSEECRRYIRSELSEKKRRELNLWSNETGWK